MLISAHPVPVRGACARHERGAGKRWTRERRRTGGVSADGQVVRSRSPDAGIKPALRLRGRATEANKPGTPRRSRSSRNPLRGEGRIVRLYLWSARVRSSSAICTRGARVQRHPAFPAPSHLFRGRKTMHHPGRSVPREGGGVSFVRVAHPSRRGLAAAPQDEVERVAA